MNDYEYLPATVRAAADWHLEPQIGEQDAELAGWSMPPAARATAGWLEFGQLILVALVSGAVCGWLTLP